MAKSAPEIDDAAALRLTYPAQQKAQHRRLDAEGAVALNARFPEADFKFHWSSGKAPQSKNWTDAATSERDRILHWGKTGKREFVYHAQRSGIAVLDFDTKALPSEKGCPSAARRECASLMRRAYEASSGIYCITPSGGLHFLYLARPGCDKRAKLAGIDGKHFLELLGNGAVGAYALHESVSKAARLQPYPQFAMDLGDGKAESESDPHPHVRTINDFCAEMRRSTKRGSRNDALFSLSYKLARVGKNSPSAIAKLKAAAEAAFAVEGEFAPTEIDATQKSGDAKGAAARAKSTTTQKLASKWGEASQLAYAQIDLSLYQAIEGQREIMVFGPDGWEPRDPLFVESSFLPLLLAVNPRLGIDGLNRATEAMRKLVEKATIGRTGGRADEWDPHPYAVGLPGRKALRLTQVGLQKGVFAQRPDMLITKKLPVAPASDATPERERLDKFLLAASRDANGCEDPTWVMRLLQHIGAALLPRNMTNALPCLIGVAGCGKTTLMDIVCEAVGELATKLGAEGFMTAYPKDMFSMSETTGRRICVIDEVPNASKFNAMRLNALAGSKTVNVREMRKGGRTLLNEATIFIVANDAPGISGMGTAGLLRRLEIIPFDYVPPPAERDIALVERLTTKAALEAMLAAAIEGLSLYWQNLDADSSAPFAPCARIQQATLDYKTDNVDLMRQFAHAWILPANDRKAAHPIMLTDLRTAYLDYCRRSGNQVSEGHEIPQREFNLRIKNLFHGYIVRPGNRLALRGHILARPTDPQADKPSEQDIAAAQSRGLLETVPGEQTHQGDGSAPELRPVGDLDSLPEAEIPWN